MCEGGVEIAGISCFSGGDISSEIVCEGTVIVLVSEIAREKVVEICILKVLLIVRAWIECIEMMNILDTGIVMSLYIYTLFLYNSMSSVAVVVELPQTPECGRLKR